MRTDVYAFPAAYAFERVRVFRWIYSHPAGFRAGGASVAFCFIHAHSENSRAVEKRIKKAVEEDEKKTKALEKAEKKAEKAAAKAAKKESKTK